MPVGLGEPIRHFDIFEVRPIDRDRRFGPRWRAISASRIELPAASGSARHNRQGRSWLSGGRSRVVAPWFWIGVWMVDQGAFAARRSVAVRCPSEFRRWRRRDGSDGLISRSTGLVRLKRARGLRVSTMRYWARIRSFGEPSPPVGSSCPAGRTMTWPVGVAGAVPGRTAQTLRAQSDRCGSRWQMRSSVTASARALQAR